LVVAKMLAVFGVNVALPSGYACSVTAPKSGSVVIVLVASLQVALALHSLKVRLLAAIAPGALISVARR
jgi:hypothetical protein